MPFVIEDNVPKPGTGDAELEAVLAKMEVGQSFFYPGKAARNLGLTLSTIGRRLGRKFESHTVEGGARVWRVEGTYAPTGPRKKPVRKPKAVTAPLQAAE